MKKNGEKPFPATGNRKPKKKKKKKGAVQESNVSVERLHGTPNKPRKQKGGEAAWCCTFIVSLSWLSRLTTHETKEIQKKKNPGYFIQVYPVISRRFRRRGRRNNVFHASRTIMWGHLACQVNSLFLYILPQSSLLFFSPPFSIWENLVSWWCAGATHHVHCIVCYFLFSHSFSFILWFFFFSFLFIFFSSGFRIETVANGAFVHVLPGVRWAWSHRLPAVSESRTWRTKTATGK